MTWSSVEFYAWLAKILETSYQAVEQWVWGGLVLGFLFATVHLITMMVTRWGDHHASSKALVFSVLVHMSSGVGVVVFAPDLIREKVIPKEDPIRLQDVRLLGTHDTPEATSGNTPVWETIPLESQLKASRLLREVPTPPEEPLPERPLENSTALESLANSALPQTKMIRTPRLDRPELALNQPTEKQTEAAVIPELEQPELPALEVNPAPGTGDNAAKIERSLLPRSITTAEEVQRPAAGGMDQLAPELTPPQQLKTLDRETLQGPTPQLPEQAPPAEMVERRLAPEQAAPDNLITGEAQPTGDEAAPRNMTENRTITRSRRTPNTAPDSPEVNRQVRPSTSAESLLEGTELAMTPSQPGEDPVPQLPAMAVPQFEAVRREQSVPVPPTYRLRDLARRQEVAQQYGGTEASEAAVERSLAWLASVQEPEGHWDGSKHGSGQIKIDEQGINRLNAGLESDTGLTGLAILAFLGAGYTQEEGRYNKNVTQAINWLIDQQREDGYLGGKATRYAGMYCHGISTYALAEAYGMQSEHAVNDRLLQAVTKGVQFSVATQNQEDGGWRYLPGWSGDMSMFGWHMMALKSAQIAGVNIPEKSQNLMVKFLVDRSLGTRKGLAAYHPQFGAEITPAMTAEALFCKQMLGMRRENAASQEAVEYLLNEKNFPRMSYPNLYYWYYGTLAMYQYGGQEWEQWNGRLRELLLDAQVKKGPNAGSWEPDGPWGGYGGRIYTTTLATLCLEVYYRFLPLYRLGEAER